MDNSSCDDDTLLKHLVALNPLVSCMHFQAHINFTISKYYHFSDFSAILKDYRARFQSLFLQTTGMLSPGLQTLALCFHSLLDGAGPTHHFVRTSKRRRF